MLRYWLPHSPVYLLNLTQLSDTNASPVGVPTPPKWYKNVPMCLSNFPKILVHGALIDAEILTPPCICSTWPRFGHWCSACGHANTFQVVYKFSYVSQESPNTFGALGPNRCWDIDFPTPLYICSNWPSFQVPILHPLVCQHLPSSLKMFLCVSGISK